MFENDSKGITIAIILNVCLHVCLFEYSTCTLSVRSEIKKSRWGCSSLGPNVSNL